MDGSGGLQSGFVLAVIVGAVLFADRLGGGREVARRLFQVALAAAIAFAVIAGTTAFIRPPDVADTVAGSGAFGEPDDEEQLEYFRDVADRNAAATTTHAGIGVLVLLAGLASLRRMSTLPIGIALGGLLLILFGSTRTGGDSDLGFFSAYSGLIGTAIGATSRGIDIAHFVLMLGGVAALLLFGYTQWEQHPASSDSDAAPLV
jgi:hypothetical protein